MADGLLATGLFVPGREAPRLDGVSVAMEPGERWAVIGPNGAGKTTLLLCLAGILRPERGEVRHGGEAVAAMPIARRVQTLSFVPQEVESHWKVPVAGVVAHGARWNQDPAAGAEALERLGVGHLAGAMLDTLSAGERHRALIAAGLAQGSPVLLLDEPDAFLDPGQRARLEDRLPALATAEGLVALTTHRLGLARRFATHILLLDGGRVAYSGPAGGLGAGRAAAPFGLPPERLEGWA